jgi:hypothetical protein
MKTLTNYKSNGGIGYTKGSGSGDPSSYSFIAEITEGESYDAEEWTRVENYDYEEIKTQLACLDPKAEMSPSDILAVFVRELSEMCGEYVVVTNW